MSHAMLGARSRQLRCNAPWSPELVTSLNVSIQHSTEHWAPHRVTRAAPLAAPAKRGPALWTLLVSLYSELGSLWAQLSQPGLRPARDHLWTSVPAANTQMIRQNARTKS